jgi:hypothetical protein
MYVFVLLRSYFQTKIRRKSLNIRYRWADEIFSGHVIIG